MIQELIRKLIKSKVARNAGWIIMGRVAQALIGIIVGLLTARYLGPSNYGVISYAIAYATFFNSFCTLGTTSVIVKELTDHPENEGQILGTTIGMRIISSFLSAAVIVMISCIVDWGEPVTIRVVIITSIGIIFHVFETFHYWFQYKLASKVTAIVATIAYVVVAAYRVVLLILNKSVEFFAFATTLDYILLAILLYIAYKKQGGKRLQVNWKYGKLMLSKSYHFILTGLMVAIYSQTDKLMLKHMMNSEETGYYATAVYVCNLWCFVLTAIISSLYPTIMEANNRDQEDFKKKNKLLYAIVFYMSLTVSLGFTLFGKPIILILYGEAYLPAVLPLQIVTWYTAFSYLGVARDAWVVAKNRQKYLKWIYISSAILNVGLNYILIPVLGASGAALASCAAQVFTIFGAPLFIKPMRENTKLIAEAVLLKGLRNK